MIQLIPMKKKYLIPVLLMILALSFSSSCKKDDNGDGTIPEIVILGFNPANWPLDLPYLDAGAVAFDVTSDGDTVDITDKIVVMNNIDVSVVGDYVVTYNVSDDSGEKAVEQVRSVKVVLGK